MPARTMKPGSLCVRIEVYHCAEVEIYKRTQETRSQQRKWPRKRYGKKFFFFSWSHSWSRASFHCFFFSFSWSLSWLRACFLSFFFIAFFYKFSPQVHRSSEHSLWIHLWVCKCACCLKCLFKHFQVNKFLPYINTHFAHNSQAGICTSKLSLSSFNSNWGFLRGFSCCWKDKLEWKRGGVEYTSVYIHFPFIYQRLKWPQWL